MMKWSVWCQYFGEAKNFTHVLRGGYVLQSEADLPLTTVSLAPHGRLMLDRLHHAWEKEEDSGGAPRPEIYDIRTLMLVHRIIANIPLAGWTECQPPFVLHRRTTRFFSTYPLWWFVLVCRALLLVVDSVCVIEQHNLRKTRFAIISNLFDLIQDKRNKKSPFKTVQNEFYDHHTPGKYGQQLWRLSWLLITHILKKKKTCNQLCFIIAGLFCSSLW